MESTRRIPVPFNRKTRQPARCHLVPKLTATSGGGFLRLPGLRAVEYGMIGFLGPAITTDDVLERWEESEPLPIPRAEAAAAIDQYFREIQVFKVGTIVEVS
jgi:hypothetical protein